MEGLGRTAGTRCASANRRRLTLLECSEDWLKAFLRKRQRVTRAAKVLSGPDETPECFFLLSELQVPASIRFRFLKDLIN